VLAAEEARELLDSIDHSSLVGLRDRALMALMVYTFARGGNGIPKNGGKREIAQQMANHESARTTGLYDRRDDQVSLDEVERMLI
jgi:hypothetical protein